MAVATSIETAAQRVRQPEFIMARHRRLISRLRKHGGDTRHAETLLAVFERSLAILRANRDSLLSETAAPSRSDGYSRSLR